MIEGPGRTPEFVPFATTANGVTGMAWGEHSVLGPVSPSGIVLLPSDRPDFNLMIVFRFVFHATGSDAYESATFDFVGSKQRKQFPRMLLANGDTLACDFNLYGRWETLVPMLESSWSSSSNPTSTGSD